MTTNMKLQADYKRAFKNADIRAIYPQEIDEELVYFVARAFVEEFGYKKVLVGRDMRLSTPALHEAFVKGATDSGAEVVDIGMVHSPMLYYASGTLELPGAMITASHSPKAIQRTKAHSRWSNSFDRKTRSRRDSSPNRKREVC
jgi:phosphomannomutase